MLPCASHATPAVRTKLSPGMPAPGRSGRAAAARRRRWRAGRCAARRRRARRRHGLPAADRRALQAPAASRAAARRAGAHGDRFRLAAHHQLNAAVGIELDHLRRSAIDDPDVVLRIDAHRLRVVEAVDADADLADELAGLIELEQPRAGLVEGARRADRRVRRAGARVDEDVPLRVGRDAGRLAQVDVVGQLQQIGVRVVGDLGDVLRGERGAERQRRGARRAGGMSVS